ncbi:MAG: FtsL-like putative cell division protein [Bacteroidales bacterium]|nr:FtsL-like putative cell division protein [Bacteroidales bacterium]
MENKQLDSQTVQETVGTPVKKKASVGTLLVQILGGDFLMREWARNQLNFLFFLATLALFYIANSYYAESTSRNIDEVARELKELQYEYVSTKSELMQAGKQSEIARKMAPSGMVESIEPVKKIIVKMEQ